jgi:hypothetical protein
MNLPAFSIASIVVSTLHLDYLISTRRFFCDAKKIDSYDLFVGHWDTTIRLQSRRQQSNLIEIFKVTNNTHSSYLLPQDCKVQPKPSTSLIRPWCFNHCPCRLSVYPNGTFRLMSSNNPRSSNPKTYTTDTMYPSISMRGRWKLQVNPYCVTDRFYDDLMLIPYPRIQKMIKERVSVSRHREMDVEDDRYNNHSQSIEKEIIPIQKVQLKLRCRLSGHFTAGRRPFLPWFYGQNECYARGKLTHGLMIMDTCDLQNNHDASKSSYPRIPVTSWFINRYHKRPKIIGSFSARRCIHSLKDLPSLSNDDTDNFGY